MTPEELNLAKYRLDLMRFRFERARTKREQRFLFRHSAVLITAALSLASIVISIATVLNNVQATKRNENTQLQETARKANAEAEATKRELAETERKASFELLQYVTSNYDLIYSQETLKQVRIKNAMEPAFPKPALSRLFLQWASSAPTLDGPNVWQRDLQQQDVTVLASPPPSPLAAGTATALPATRQEALEALTGPRRRVVVEQIARQKDRAVLDLLIASLLPQSDSASYRFNLYAAVALARVADGWSGSEGQLAQVAALRQSGNYTDPTFKKWVDAALKNHAGSGP